MTGPGDLIEELRGDREAFFAALERVDRSSLTARGLSGEWSARELVAHLGYWTGHATELIHAVESGRADEVGEGEPPVDEVNETVARVARETDLGTVRRREEGSYGALVDRLRQLEPALLEVRLPSGETVADAIREDAADHYREHADQLREMLDAPAHG